MIKKEDDLSITALEQSKEIINQYNKIMEQGFVIGKLKDEYNSLAEEFDTLNEDYLDCEAIGYKKGIVSGIVISFLIFICVRIMSYGIG